MWLINYIPEGKGGGLQSLVFLISFQFLVQICVSNPIGTSQSLDPIRNDYEEGVDPSFIRTKREPGAVNSESEYVPGESLVEFTGGRMIRRRQTGTENVVDTYKPVKKLDYSHPYRKKVKPVEKPITPYFVRILKRRPVGLSAMNYTTPDDHAFENSDNGEIIDVPKVLVDRRRNKNVDSIHPIYVVENDDEDQEQEAQVSKAVLQNSQDVQQLLPVNTSYLFIPTSNEPKVFTEPNSPPTTTTTTIPPETTTVPVLKFRRLMRFKPRDYTTTTTEETRTTTDYPSYATETSQDLASNSTTSNHSDTIDYLPLEFDYERDPQNYTIKSLVTDPTTSTTNVPSMKFRAYDMETIRNNRKRVLTQNVPSPQTVVLSRVPHRLENLPVPVPQVSTTAPPAGNPGLLGDYGYGGVVIGGGVRDRATMDSEHVIEQVSTTSIPVTTRAPVTTTTTTAVPTTTTTTTTEVPTTTTTTTTTTEEPTTTSTSTTSTTTTTTTTSTTPMPVALRMRMRETPTTTVPSTLPTAEPLTNLMTMTDDQLLTELMAKIPKDADLNEELTPEQATTLQQMILAHLLNSTPVTLSPQESVKFTKTPQDYQDLQTAASSTTGLFTTRADVGSSGGAGVTNAIVQTTTKNPLLQFFDNLAGHSQQQQQRSAPSSQASSFVRPIQEVNSSGGRADANKPPEFSMGDILRMMIQLPGNILVGVLRFMRTTGEFLGGIMNGVMKMLSGIANAGSGGGGLFNG